VNNFIILAAKNLRKWNFLEWLKVKLTKAEVLYADETGINIGGKNHWVHGLSSSEAVYLHVDSKRGFEAMEKMGVLNNYKNFLVHDHWKPYFKFDSCSHVLCNAHHLRELERAIKQDEQKWAEKIKNLLLSLHQEINETEEKRFEETRICNVEAEFLKIIQEAENECPQDNTQVAQSKSRNLLLRLSSFQEETLRFIKYQIVPFTNNYAERIFRFLKVQQKISGCFRSLRGAEDFCLIKSYLSTALLQGLSMKQALMALFEEKKPSFLDTAVS
jgi:transposase